VLSLRILSGPPPAGIEQAVRSFPLVPPGEWEREQWFGFFTALRERLGDGEWAVRGHGGGGSLTFRWNRKGGKYLRLHEGELAFCLEVTEQTQRAARWAEWNRTLMARAGTVGIALSPARRKAGKRMTVAILDGDYRQQDGQGLIDLSRTVETLAKATALMDAALGPSGDTGPLPEATG
jgi:hypothetical protein